MWLWDLKGQWGGESNCSGWAALHNAFLMQWLIIVIIFISKDAARARHIYFLFSLPKKYNISSFRGIPYVPSLYSGSMLSYVATNGELPCFHYPFCDSSSLFQYQLEKANQSLMETPSLDLLISSADLLGSLSCNCLGLVAKMLEFNLMITHSSSIGGGAGIAVSIEIVSLWN